MHGLMLTVRRARRAAVAVVCVCAVAPAGAQQPPPDASFVLEKVAVTGLKRYSAEEVVRTSGLSAGTSVRLAELEGAASRMAETGLFDKVSYRYATASNRVTVTLEIVEATWTMPVVFDNFVWMTAAELTGEVGRDMPTFDGTVPGNDGARITLAKALQKSVASRGLPGAVEVVPFLNLKTKAQQYVAKVTNPSPRVCAVRTTGTSPAMEKEVKAVTDPLSGTDYSRAYLVGMSAGTLLGVYHKRGHWAAVVGAPEASFDSSCGGVVVSLAFDEGSVYQWDGADWNGNSRLPADQLIPLLPFRSGDVADSTKLDDGIRRVRDLYGTVGHLAAAVTYVAHVTPSTQRVRFAMEVAEGPQFRMGTLTVTGLAPQDAANLQKKWKLKPGDVYSTAAAQVFFREELVPLLRQKGLRSDGLELKAGTVPQTLDVTINARK
ncbi:MAG: hypothetical protein IPL75_18670 [Acidobacteria bacterium]|nr:hypothetical protein [Acidobacteriota bacterium]